MKKHKKFNKYLKENNPIHNSIEKQRGRLIKCMVAQRTFEKSKEIKNIRKTYS